MNKDNNTILPHHEVIDEFRRILIEAGAVIDGHLRVDCGLVRVRATGDKSNQKSFYYNIHTDNVPTMSYGCWKWNLKEKVSLKTKAAPMSIAERARMKNKIEAQKRQRQQEQEDTYREAQRKAINIWRSISTPASENHPYLIRKHIQQSAEKIRCDKHNNLIIPLFKNREIVSLQFIDGNGNKRFLKGGEISGAYFMFPNPKNIFDLIYISESFSTSASLHYCLTERENLVSAMNAGNLLQVALSVREAYPNAKIVLACDNDLKTDRSINIGVEKGIEAARAVSGFYVVPQFADGGGGDWNDLHVQQVQNLANVETP